MQVPITIDVKKYIEVRLMGERPHIHGRRLPVSLLAKVAASKQWSVARTAEEFSLSDAQVLSAMLYYEENKAVLDKQDEQDDILFENLREQSE